MYDLQRLHFEGNGTGNNKTMGGMLDTRSLQNCIILTVLSIGMKFNVAKCPSMRVTLHYMYLHKLNKFVTTTHCTSKNSK